MTAGRIAFGLLVGSMAAVYLTMIFWSLPGIKAMSGGLGPFDLRMTGYTGDDARAFLAGLNQAGRGFYLTVQMRLDAAFAALLGIVLALSFRHIAGGYARLALIGFAVLAAGFDFLENAAVHQMLTGEPASVTDAAVARASRWTVMKFAATFGAILALVVLIWRRWELVWRRQG